MSFFYCGESHEIMRASSLPQKILMLILQHIYNAAIRKNSAHS
ncbi:hypothetical protein ACVWWJ_002871 [Luteibacter sp. HA06]